MNEVLKAAKVISVTFIVVLIGIWIATGGMYNDGKEPGQCLHKANGDPYIVFKDGTIDQSWDAVQCR